METNNNEALVKDMEKFSRVWKEIFSGENGKFAKKMLKQQYVDTSALAQTPEQTYYLLGQKELIQHLIANMEEK